ncbi:MAG: hypothetical protein JW793_00755 [Acidobacteria bacterium]|nr:hypothetical protein [Acidobacteriota bacterium]
MTSRLIKLGTRRALGIQHFQYKEDSPEYAPGIETAPPMHFPGLRKSGGESGGPEMEKEVAAVETDEIERDAYQRGFEQGEIAARECAEREMESIMKRYADSFREISGLRSALYSSAEKEVVRLAVEIAKKIVHREIKADPNILHTLVRVALSRVTDRSSAIVRLNPVDYQFLTARKDAAAQALEGDVSFRSDNSIEQGGCLVQTSCGDIDARFGERFREVENAFFEDLE